MFVVESYAAVRRFVFVEGHSRREAARVFGLSRETVLKMYRFSLPPGYTRTRPAAKPKLGPLLPVIDAILEADRTAPVKQRHTAKRIYERLRDEHGFAGGYTVVKDHVRVCRARGRETFVPLAHPPGHAQVDFGEAIAIVGDVRKKIRFFCMDLPQSDACFVKAYPAETTEAGPCCTDRAALPGYDATGAVPVTGRGVMSCRSKPMPTAATTSRSSVTESQTLQPTMRPCGSAAA